MIRVIIFEDELPSARRITNLLKEVDDSISVEAIIDSVEEGTAFLNREEAPDLIIMDIQLSDGSSFELFKKVEIHTPIIFVTAYDQYAVQAFRVAGIDYLLKPVKKSELTDAIGKFKQLYLQKARIIDYNLLANNILSQSKTYQKRILIKFGDKVQVIDTDRIAYFYTSDRIIYLCTLDNRNLPIDEKMEELTELLDPSAFYRINRKMIINLSAIKKIYQYSRSRFKIMLEPPSIYDAIVSSERSKEFQLWLKGIQPDS